MELAVTLRQPGRRAELFGPNDAWLRELRNQFGVRFQARGETIRILGEPPDVARVAAVIEQLQDILRRRDCIDADDLRDAVAAVVEADRQPARDALGVFARDAAIAPKTDGQRHYVHAMLHHDLVFCLGPAGTGKTYLAVAVAVHLLKQARIKRIVLVRPAVEAGEKLGFLPGDLQQKVNPYLRPLFDAMHDMMTYDQLKRFMVSDVIEVIPLAYMRGRTLNNAVIILDEAQNSTPQQMLMFLTRLGQHSRMIVTGDDSQVDLEPNQRSGLIDAVRRLRHVPGVSVLRLTDSDIVRHRLVQDIVARYAGLSGEPSVRESGNKPAADSHGPPQAPSKPDGVNPSTASADP